MRLRLILIADAPTVPWRDVMSTLEAVFAAVGGERLLVLDRDRDQAAGGTGDAVRLSRLRALRELTRAAGAGLAVTGRVDLALAAGADGVQLPEAGLPLATVRRLFPGLQVGRSCHDRAGLRAAEDGGADWATLAPIRAPWSKPLAGAPLGVEGFAACVVGLTLPVYALGGVGADLAPALASAGAAGLATIGGVFGTTSPAAAAQSLLAAWDGQPRRAPEAS